MTAHIPNLGDRRPQNPEIGERAAKLMGFGVVLVILVGAAFGTVATAWQKTPADKIAVSYGGGPFEGNQFQKIVNPGSSLVFNGFLDQWYEYPVTQRNYIVSQRPDEGDVTGTDVIQATTDDNIAVSWEVSVFFKLNANQIRSFHENIGLKYEAWTDEGWDRMLNDSFRQQLEGALQTESRKHTTEDLLSDEDAIAAVQRGIATSLKERVSTVLGDDYFCGPTFALGDAACPDFTVTVKKPIFPEDVIAAYKDQEIAAAELVSAQNRANAAEAEGQGVNRAREALQDSLTPEFIAYLQAQAMQDCARNAGCTLVVTPGTGANVNVNTSSPTPSGG